MINQKKVKYTEEQTLRVKELLNKAHLSKTEAQTIYKWYNNQTGVRMNTCFCTSPDRESLQQTVREYLKIQ